MFEPTRSIYQLSEVRSASFLPLIREGTYQGQSIFVLMFHCVVFDVVQHPGGD